MGVAIEFKKNTRMQLLKDSARIITITKRWKYGVAFRRYANKNSFFESSFAQLVLKEAYALVNVLIHGQLILALGAGALWAWLSSLNHRASSELEPFLPLSK